MPHAGRMDVTPVARRLFSDMLTEREAKGIATYGTTLQTFNGRNAIADALEEVIDAWQYIVQVGLENDAMKRTAEDLEADLAAERGMNGALRRDIQELTAERDRLAREVAELRRARAS